MKQIITDVIITDGGAGLRPYNPDISALNEDVIADFDLLASVLQDLTYDIWDCDQYGDGDDD